MVNLKESFESFVWIGVSHTCILKELPIPVNLIQYFHTFDIIERNIGVFFFSLVIFDLT